jgi:hypothetical protein
LCPSKITVYFFGKEQTATEFNVNEFTGIATSTTPMTNTPMMTKPPIFYRGAADKAYGVALVYHRQNASAGWDPTLAGRIADWNQTELEDGEVKKISESTGIAEVIIHQFNSAKVAAISKGERAPTGITPIEVTGALQSEHVRAHLGNGGEGGMSSAGRGVSIQIGWVHATAEARILQTHLVLTKARLLEEGLLISNCSGQDQVTKECCKCKNVFVSHQRPTGAGAKGGKAVCRQCDHRSSNAGTKSTEVGQVRKYLSRGSICPCVFVDGILWKWGSVKAGEVKGWIAKGSADNSLTSRNGQWFGALPAIDEAELPEDLRKHLGLVVGTQVSEEPRKPLERQASIKRKKTRACELETEKQTAKLFKGKILEGKIFRSNEGAFYW